MALPRLILEPPKEIPLMRKTLALAALGAAAAALLPASASASCVDVGVGGCHNPCSIASDAYRTADSAARDKLPDVWMDCVA